MSEIEIRPLSPVIGAEVFGIDLTRPLGKEQYSAVHDALIRHKVIFFRDQPIDLERHKALGRMFGELAIHPASPGPDGHPEVLIIHADASSKHINGENWHSDVSCDAEPPMGSILHIHTLPETGGDTLFANMEAAYEALSPPMQAFLDGLTAVHKGERLYRGRYAHQGVEDATKVYPSAEHPVVRRHPETGRKCLFVNPTFTDHIVQLSRHESDALLAMLYAHAAQPAFQCRFRWAKHSIAIWDNRCTQHQALWDYYPATRSGYRVTIKGDRPH